MSDGSGLAEALLGLPGFRVLAVTEGASEVTITVETTAVFVGCRVCGTRAESQDRMLVEIRDLACFGRPARLVWNKRRWRCPEVDCAARTWTETSEEVSSRALLTQRAGIEACRQVGENARPVSELAEELGVCWWTWIHSTSTARPRMPPNALAFIGSCPSPYDPSGRYGGFRSPAALGSSACIIRIRANGNGRRFP